MSLLSAVNSILGGGSENANYDVFSYQTILKDLQNYRQAGGVSSNEFNELDTPTHKFFRLMFHFYNGDENSPDSTGYGLLHPTWQFFPADLNSVSSTDTTTYMKDTGEMGADFGDANYWVSPSIEGRADELWWWNYSTAYSYLMINNEFERAQYCKAFIELLSNISTYSPWYFQSINGLNEAINRKFIADSTAEFKERDHITINCLDDSVDNRIATLLDLYRAFTWSWRTRRFIVPSNLRKFDMTIAVIEHPIKTLHHPKNEVKLTDALGQVGEWLTTESTDYATINLNDTEHYLTSYKMYEFHNCEIDYNSSSTGVETVDNAEGWTPQYKIDIYFDDIEEYSYNEFLQGISEFGDLVRSDSLEVKYKDRNDLSNHEKKYNDPEVINESIAEDMREDQQDTVEDRLDTSSGLFTQVEGALTGWVQNKVDSAVMGNLFGFSVTRLAEDVAYAMSGNILSTATRIAYDNTNYDGHKNYSLRNLNEDEAQKMSAIKSAQDLGNIFSSSTSIRSV